MKRRFETIDLNRIRTISLAKRKSLVSFKKMARVMNGSGAGRFLDSLPQFLKANDLKKLIDAIASARRKNKPVILMSGGHLIKVGLSPIIIDLVKTGIITGICFNGAGLIHDIEIALTGNTSEDVTPGLSDGSFGMSAETARFYNQAVILAGKRNIGLGEAAGFLLNERSIKFRQTSILAACLRSGIPAMIHIAVDTDIVCQHADYDSAGAAQASHHDFKILAHQIARGENGGVFINIGSAVVLPEVFLKALTVARNIYGKPYKIITANFDMLSQYRPITNFVNRPTVHGGKGYNFIGHHEIMIPLLAWGIKGAIRNKKNHKSG